MKQKTDVEKIVRDIRRRTRKQYSAEPPAPGPRCCAVAQIDDGAGMAMMGPK